MSEINPILLLIAGLLCLGLLIAWGLGIYVAVNIARRRGRSVWAWALLAVGMGFVPFGPVFLCTGYLARTRRRSAAGWVAAQVAAFMAVVAAAWVFRGEMNALPVAGQLWVILAAVMTALLPAAVLATIAPGRTPAGRSSHGGAMVRAIDVHKTYRMGKRDLKVLRGVSLSVQPGEFIAILGASGSGKSTLLHLLGLLDTADAGRVVLDGADSAEMASDERDAIRCRDIGFVFQFYHLLAELTVLENVLMPAMTAVGPLRWLAVRRQARRRAMEILDRVGLSERLKHRPKELSGGEQQRVAIARALLNRPKILLADEPTGNLDSRTGGQILTLLKELNTRAGQTIVLVTHDKDLAGAASRVLHLRDGKLQ